MQPRFAAWGGEVQRVLCGQSPRIREPGADTKTAPAGALLDHPVAVIKERRVAPEAVNEKPGNHRRILRVDHRLRAHNLRNHPAAVDVACQDHWNVRRPRKAHVGDVARAQIDLGRAARALD